MQNRTQVKQLRIRAFTMLESLLVLGIVSLLALGLSSSVQSTFAAVEEQIFFMEFEELYRETQKRSLASQQKMNLMLEERSIGNGYQVGEGVASPATVTVKAASSIVDQVEQVVANVSIPEGTRTDYTTTAQLQALDATGKPVAVKIDPERVQVRVPISSSQKTVPLVLTTTGSSSNYSYLLNSTTKQVTILGAQSSLDQIKAIPVLVDVSNITQSTTKTITLTLPSGVHSISPETIEVTITVTRNSLTATEASTTQTVTTEEPTETTKEQTTQAQ